MSNFNKLSYKIKIAMPAICYRDPILVKSYGHSFIISNSDIVNMKYFQN